MQRSATAIVVAGLAGLVGCGDNAAARDAGAPDGDDDDASGDAGGASDGGGPLTWIDFALAGCPDLGGLAGPDAGPGDAPPACRGPAPLTLGFVAVAPAAIDLYAWSFGDDSEVDTRAAPTHRFALPGRYDVELDVQGPGGTVGVRKPEAIEVVAAGAGGACELDAQCALGGCVCAAADGCGEGAGLCAASCADGGCGEGEACVRPGGGVGPAPWQAPICALDCATAGCPAGLACRDLPTATGFARGCFPPGLGAELGGSCADERGAPVDAACATGSCLAAGLRGLCTGPCDDGECPAGAACAAFHAGGPSVCLRRCATGGAGCDGGDPWLACELAGGPGARGFTVDESPSVDGYCAPRTCDDAADCTVGRCVAGFCAP